MLKIWASLKTTITKNNEKRTKNLSEDFITMMIQVLVLHIINDLFSNYAIFLSFIKHIIIFLTNHIYLFVVYHIDMMF
jgi:hypothetical protein